jgi:hypothetical protein
MMHDTVRMTSLPHFGGLHPLPFGRILPSSFDIGQQRIADVLNAPVHLLAHLTPAALPAPGITPPRPGGRKAEPALLPGFAP